MFDETAEKRLQEILTAVRDHIPPHAMPILEQTIRSYGKVCGHNAVINHLTTKMEGGPSER